jgi:hypothetical protein
MPPILAVNWFLEAAILAVHFVIKDCTPGPEACPVTAGTVVAWDGLGIRAESGGREYEQGLHSH